MIANYYTLWHIAKHLDRLLSGWTLTEAFTQHKCEFVFRFNDPEEHASETFVIAGCLPSKNFLFARREFHRAKKNTVNLFSAALGKNVASVRMHAADREATFAFTDGSRMLVRLFGSSANVLLVDPHDSLIDAFLRKNILLGMPLEQSTRFLPALVESMSEVSDRLQSAEGTTLSQRLRMAFPSLGGVLAKEVAHRAAIPADRAWNELVEAELLRVSDAVYGLMNELRSSARARILFADNTPLEFSLVPLRYLRADREEVFDSPHDGVRTFLRLESKSDSFLKQKSELLAPLRSERERLERTLGKISSGLPMASLAAEYERLGKLLQRNIHLAQKGSSSLSVDENGSTVEIALDVHLNPAKNVERYFEKARKTRTSTEEQGSRAEKLRASAIQIAQLEEELESVVSAEEHERFVAAHGGMLATLGFEGSGSDKKSEPRIPFRVFTVHGGFQAWAGKSGENNDLLSTRFTAKTDFWFHARGVGGSHVVLKVGTAKGAPSKRAIQQTASIAAYYSKMKKASMVPVAMCEGKYVRKPRGASPGTVTIERETVVYAEPALPEGEV
jgi:predicted ribosome quality control (RQC) complex YloA/Tae2 family protein